MPGQEHVFDRPDRFVAGTVGQPGERTFYLQASGGGQLVSVAVEKVQVAALAERLDEMLDEVRRREGPGSDIPADPPPTLDDVAPLDTPLLEEFRVGTLALAWDPDDRMVVIEAQSVEVEATDPAAGEEQELTGDVLRVRLSPLSARAFARRAARVVAAGRPPCPLCGLPVDPGGHVCPRQNGHRH